MKKRNFIGILLTGIILYLTHHLWIVDKNNYNFDFYVFSIITILGYLVSTKLTSYLADFKDIKKQSRIDIVFLAIFFIILFIPMSKINKERVSIGEHRALATWKPLISEEGSLNYSFGKSFDNWFNDRFFTRLTLVSAYMDFRYFIAHKYYETQTCIINKTNNWMLEKSKYKNIKLSDKNLNTTVENIKKLQEFCNKNNIKPYIIISPSKYAIYKDNLYPYIGRTNEVSETKQIISYIKEQTNMEVIYPYEQMKEKSKEDYVFFKSDHHWTDDGAYIGYLELMKQVKLDYPNIYISKPEDYTYSYSNKIRVEPDKKYHRGRTYEKISLHKNNYKALDVNYKYYRHKNFDKIKLSTENFSKDYYHFKHVTYNINAPKLVLFGDSFGENLMQSIIFSFRDTERIYTYAGASLNETMNIERFEDFITKTKPEVLVICFSEIDRIMYLYKNDSKEQ